MVLDVKIPAMGESITGGLLASWAVKSGDGVKKGQALFSFETDKITSDATAEADGLINIKVAAGTEVLVGQVVASIDSSVAASASSSSAASAPTSVAVPTQAKTAAIKTSAPALTKSVGASEISPAVRRIAAETPAAPVHH